MVNSRQVQVGVAVVAILSITMMIAAALFHAKCGSSRGSSGLEVHFLAGWSTVAY